MLKQLTKYPLQILFGLTFIIRLITWIILDGLSKLNFTFSKFQLIDGLIAPDEYEYVQIATNIVNGLGFWNPERGGELYFSEPVHPLIMSIILLFFKNINFVILFQSLISSISTILLFLILRKLHFSTIFSFFSSLIMILHPHINFWNAKILPESLRVFGLLLMLFFALRLIESKTIKNTIYFGIVCGFAALIRFPYGIMIPFLSLYYLIFYKNNKIHIIMFLGTALIVFSPWFIRNYYHTNSIFRYSIYERFAHGLKPETIYRITDNEKYQNMGGNYGVLREEVVDNDLRNRNPIIFYVELFSLRIFEFYKFYPTSNNYSTFEKFVSGLFSIPIFLFGVLGLFRLFTKKEWELLFFLAVPIVVLTLIHTISNTNDSRYSLPLIPLQIILCSLYFKDIILEKKIV